jgi:hypothetical protein
MAPVNPVPGTSRTSLDGPAFSPVPISALGQPAHSRSRAPPYLSEVEGSEDEWRARRG